MEKPNINTVSYKPDAPAVICYTGGSTGVPKGAVMSDYNFNAYISGVTKMGFNATPGDSAMVVAPPWTMYGISNSINAYLCMGLMLQLFPKSGQDMFGMQIIQNRPNHIVAVPSGVRSFMELKEAENADLSYIKTLILGAEKLDVTFEENADRWLQEHKCNAKITKGYGMTEIGAAVCYTKGDSNIPATVGIPYVTDTVTVFNELNGIYVEGKYGEQGEICVLSPKCMVGYAGSGAKQNPLILKKHQDGVVWAHTGDIGHVDKNGCVYIDGRIKRMIVRDGYKVFPAAVEMVLSKHSNVKECAVVGIKDRELGYAAKVYLVLKNCGEKDQTIEQLKKMCESELYSYEIPDYFEVIEKMPLTNVGKVDYQKLIGS